MEALDQYMLRQTLAFASDVKGSYDEFAFHKIYHRLNHFCIVDLSAFYFDVLKDRLYISAPKSQARRSAQTAIWRIGEALVRLLAPIMTFTSEEVWQYLPKAAESRRKRASGVVSFGSGHSGRSDFCSPSAATAKADEDWTTLRAVRDEVLKALEEARNSKLIGTGLEAQVTVAASDPVYSVLARHVRPTALSVHRFCGNAYARLRQWHQRGTRRSEESGRIKVRALLELFDACGRG